MSESQNINQQIQNALDNLDVEQARLLLREALKNNANSETYFLASQAALTPQQRETFLKKALELDPFHTQAYAQLNQSATPVGAAVSSNLAVSIPAYSTVVATATPATNSVTIQASSIKAVVSSTANLMVMPDSQATVRAQVPPLSELLVLAREPGGDWCNVVYASPMAGVRTIGWVQSQYLRNVYAGSRLISINDLPVSQYEYNTREDVKMMANLVYNRWSSDPVAKWKVWGGWAIVIIGIFTLVLLFGILAIIGGFLLINDGLKPFKEERKRLMAISASLSSESETIRVQQASEANQRLASAIASGRY